MKTTRLILGLALAAAFGTAQADDACKVKIGANDMMQFDTDTLTVSAGCKTIEIELTHTGQLPVASMGHNVVITKTADYEAVAKDGLKAGPEGSYVPADDARVVAFTKLVGGGESATVSFEGSKLTAGEDYTFFCSFPGHSSVMKGKVVVNP